MSLEFHTKVVSWLACQEHPPVLKWAIGELELVPVVGFKARDRREIGGGRGKEGGGDWAVSV